jgi:hypothetical protein
MDEMAAGQASTLSVGVRAVGYLLCGVGAAADCCVGLVLLVVLTLPGVPRPTPTGLVLLVAFAALATSPLFFGIGLLSRRRWALSGAHATLVALAVAGLIAPWIAGAMFLAVAAVWMVLLPLSLGCAAYLSGGSVRYAYRAVAGPPPLLPVGVVRAATRLAPLTRILGGLGLLGLAAGAGIGALTTQPVDSSGMAKMGADIGRALVQYLAFIWFASGALTLWLRHFAFPAVMGALLTLPLAGYMLVWAPLGLTLLPGSVGLMLVVSVAFQVVARSRDELLDSEPVIQGLVGR